MIQPVDKPQQRGPAMNRRVLEAAIWAGDVATLQALAPCGCCCDEHTFESCSARLWGGCRGQGSMTRADQESWVRHYEKFHGMSRERFFG